MRPSVGHWTPSSHSTLEVRCREEGRVGTHPGIQGQGRTAALPTVEGIGQKSDPSPTHPCSLELGPRPLGASPLLSIPHGGLWPVRGPAGSSIPIGVASLAGQSQLCSSPAVQSQTGSLGLGDHLVWGTNLLRCQRTHLKPTGEEDSTPERAGEPWGQGHPEALGPKGRK